MKWFTRHTKVGYLFVKSTISEIYSNCSLPVEPFCITQRAQGEISCGWHQFELDKKLSEAREYERLEEVILLLSTPAEFPLDKFVCFRFGAGHRTFQLCIQVDVHQELYEDVQLTFPRGKGHDCTMP